MIKITKLNKYFYRHKSNEIHVINDISLQFPQTGLITILGESGCGKTTLLNVLGGLDDFSSGSIEIDDKVINKYSSKVIDKIRNEKIGFIFQNYLLLQQRTVYDNLKILLNMYDISEQEKNDRIDYVLKAVNMMRYKKKNVSELSGGQQQRVAIARALIKSPSMILADEPTGNLDEKNTIQIMNIIKRISKNTLIILVSHEKSIAYSYSDFIIELSDGKVKNQVDSKDLSTYSYEDDQNIYLKEFKYKSLKDNNINIDFYSNENKTINLQIIYQKGKFFIKTDNDVIFLNENTEINIIDDYKKDLDTNQEILENNYELKPLKFKKTPSLSFKECINLAFSNLKKLKKRANFLSFPLIVIVMLLLLSIQSVISASYIDKQQLAPNDSRIYTVDVEKQRSELNKAVHTFGYKYFCYDFIKENENIEIALDFNPTFVFSQQSFSQINTKSFSFNGFSTMPLDILNDDSIIYGRNSQNINEIVVEKWAIEQLINNTSLQNIMNVSSFVNKNIYLQGFDINYKIVGIANNNEKTVYFNKWALLNIFPSELKNSTNSIISISEYKKLKDNINISSLNKNEFIKNNKYDGVNDTIKLNNDSSLIVNCVGEINDENLPYKLIVSDELYNDLLISISATDYKKLDLICESEKEKIQVDEYVNKVYDFYFNGLLKANEENGYDVSQPADLLDVYLRLSTHSEYDEKLSVYINEAKTTVASRLLITVTILFISMLIVFFSMKSFAAKNIYDIGVFRAIGINKKSIVLIYAFEVLVISLKTTLVGAIIYYLITSFIASIPIISVPISLDFNIFVLATFLLIVINILVGIIPVSLYLRKTPSQILSKYDI